MTESLNSSCATQSVGGCANASSIWSILFGPQLLDKV